MYKYDGVKEKLNKYMLRTEIPTSSPSLEKTCYAFGYLDGYFEEPAYEDFLDFKDKMYVAYNLGYRVGEADRIRDKLTNKDDWFNKKMNWLRIIATNDGMKDVSRRISREYRNIYSEIRENANAISVEQRKKDNKGYSF